MPTARTLYDLQKIDLETDAIEESLKKFDFELNEMRFRFLRSAQQ